MPDGLIGFLIAGWAGGVFVALLQITNDLRAIRGILADIANATRATADRPTPSFRETNRLLKLAIRKQWGGAIDLEEDL